MANLLTFKEAAECKNDVYMEFYNGSSVRKKPMTKCKLIRVCDGWLNFIETVSSSSIRCNEKDYNMNSVFGRRVWDAKPTVEECNAKPWNEKVLR